MFDLTVRKPKNMMRLLNHFRNDLDEFDSIFDALSHFHGFPTLKGIEAPSFSPSIEIADKKDAYTVTAELPGMNQKDIEVTIDEENNLLVIKGEKKQESKKEGDDYFVTERIYGSFRREICLPQNVNKNNIKASFENGVLKLLISKEAEQPKKEVKKISIE